MGRGSRVGSRGGSRRRTSDPDRIVLDARAKVNLGLEVVRKRDDGYHEIRTLLQTIGLSDRIAIRRTRGEGVRLRCPGSGLPTGDENLVVRAARLLRERSGCRHGAEIVLHKRIPIGGGLGGGSSDAAATLVGLNRLWGLRMTRRDLVAFASEIGSDVPFFIRGGTQLAEGRGEILHPLPPLPRLPVAVIDPTLFLSTASIYQSGNIRLTPDGPLSRLMHCDLTSRSRALTCIARLHNDLEPAVERRAPRVARILRDIRALGSEVARVTGSGSCVFVLADDKRKLGRLLEDAPVRDCRVVTTHFERRGWFPTYLEGQGGKATG